MSEQYQKLPEKETMPEQVFEPFEQVHASLLESAPESIQVSDSTELTETSTEQINVVLELSQLLLSNVKTPSYNLTPEQMNWINQFISASPDSFSKIKTDIETITSTGQIGIQNIPQIIHLLADVYNSGALKNNLSNPANVIIFIRFTLDVIITSKYVVLPDVEKELLQSLVDTSLNLLIMNLGSIEKATSTLSSKCFHLFKCCSK
jgi:hypothetical protein